MNEKSGLAWIPLARDLLKYGTKIIVGMSTRTILAIGLGFLAKLLLLARGWDAAHLGLDPLLLWSGLAILAFPLVKLCYFVFEPRIIRWRLRQLIALRNEGFLTEEDYEHLRRLEFGIPVPTGEKTQEKSKTVEKDEVKPPAKRSRTSKTAKE